MGILYSKNRSINFKNRSAKVSPANNEQTKSYLIQTARLGIFLSRCGDCNNKNRLLKTITLSCNYGVNPRTHSAELISDYRPTKKNLRYHISLHGLSRGCNVQVSVQVYNQINKLIKNKK